MEKKCGSRAASNDNGLSENVVYIDAYNDIVFWVKTIKLYTYIDIGCAPPPNKSHRVRMNKYHSKIKNEFKLKILPYV